jgi:DNA-binding response OmpR family regulator
MSVNKNTYAGGVMKKILVVDDDKSIQILYAEELAEEGYDVITTGDGFIAMELIEKENPDVIVMDIKLGNVNGLDLILDIRSNYYDLPVILCTAYPIYKYHLKSTAANYYVVKSSNIADLKAKIEMALEGGLERQSSARAKG